MEKEVKQIIKTMFAGFLMIFILLSLIFCLLSFMEYQQYRSYREEGYKVRFDVWGYGCEMKIRNLDNTVEWRTCEPADSHTIENYGVRE